MVSGGALISAEIQLNGNILPNSSREYIAATIMHEALHAYMASSNHGENSLDHEDMAINYVTKMAASLRTMYPTLSESDARALAYGGLEGTATFNFDMSRFGLTGSHINTNLAYRNNTQGHGC